MMLYKKSLGNNGINYMPNVMQISNINSILSYLFNNIGYYLNIILLEGFNWLVIAKLSGIKFVFYFYNIQFTKIEINGIPLVW